MIQRDLAIIDAGACDWGEEESINRLRLTYRPAAILAFDPAPAASPFWSESREGTLITFRRAALWTHSRGAFLRGAGTTAHVSDDPPGTRISTVDVAKEIELAHWHYSRVILKLDIEGGEYPILDYLRGLGVLHTLDEVLVEWHGEPRGYPVAITRWQ